MTLISQTDIISILRKLLLFKLYGHQEHGCEKFLFNTK